MNPLNENQEKQNKNYGDDSPGKTIEISGDSIKEIDSEEEIKERQKSLKTPSTTDNSEVLKEEPAETEDFVTVGNNSMKRASAKDTLYEKTSQPEKIENIEQKATEKKSEFVRAKETQKKSDTPEESTKTKPVQGVVFEENKEDKEENKSTKKTIRTYQNDVVEAMKRQKESLTSMVLAEKKKDYKQKKTTRPAKKIDKKIVIIIISTLVILGGGFWGFTLISNNKTSNSPEITRQQIPSLIFPNYKREVFLDRVREDFIINALEEQKQEISIPLGYIIQLYLTTEDKTKSFVIGDDPEYKLLITAESFFDGIEASIPDSLTRNIGQDFVFGYHSSLGNNPFLILRVKSYNSAFAAMLDWENTMRRDLDPIFTKEGSQVGLDNNSFKDIVISNKDVRAILNEKGKVELAYSFPNPDTLVIVNNETTLQEMFRRVTNARLERRD